MSEPRSKAELREEFKKLKRSYHRVTCGELRKILRRYGDKQIYLIDYEGNEVPGEFHRIHDFLYSFRWELRPMSDGVASAEDVKRLSREAFKQWAFVDVPVYVCDTSDHVNPSLPAFSEYTVCGDQVIFNRTREAYVKYGELLKEWNNAVRVEAEREAQKLCAQETIIELPIVRRHFPTLFADTIIGVSPMKPKEPKE